MTSRRTAVRAGMAAIPVGISAGLGFHHWIDGSAKIRFIGQKATMIALFDTGNERVLVLLGEPDLTVLTNVPQLLPFGQSRLDLVIGSHRWLTTETIRSRLNIQQIPTISLQGSASAPPIRGNIHPITSNQRLTVGDHSEIMLLFRGDSDPDGDVTDPGIVAEIACSGVRMALANRAEAVTGVDSALHLMAIPGEVDTDAIVRLRPQLLICTSLHPDADLTEIQVFPDDPAILTIADGSIRVRGDQFLS